MSVSSEATDKKPRKRRGAAKPRAATGPSATASADDAAFNASSEATASADDAAEDLGSPTEDAEVPAPRMVRTTSAAIREQGSARSIDEITRKYAEREAGPAPASSGRALPGADVELLGPAVPPDERDALLGRDVRSELIDPPDFAGDAQPSELEDLFDIYPINGSGEYYITVERLNPRHWGGVQVSGMQRSIKTSMTRDVFAEEYGGGQYRLVVRGPAKRGRLIDPDTGMPSRKALTKPIKVTVPVDTYPPNLQASILYDDDGDDTDMQHPALQHTGRRLGPANSQADASIHKAELDHDLRLREREDRARRESAERDNAVISVLAGTMERQTDHLQETMREREERHREELRAERERAREMERRLESVAQRPSETSALGEALSNIVTALNAGGDKGAAKALDQAQSELQRMAQRHADDLDRVRTQHQEEVRRIREDHDKVRERDERAYRDDMKRAEDRLTEVRRDYDRRIEELEKRHQDRLKEIETRADKEVSQVREEMRGRMQEQQMSHQTRLDDQRAQADRDARFAEQAHKARLDAQKDMYEGRLTQLQSELARERAETARYRAEAEANKDVVGKVSEVKMLAASLGMTEGGGGSDEELPKDWKGMLSMLARDLIQKVPDITAAAGEQVRAMRSQQSQLAAMQTSGGMPSGMLPAASVPPLRARDGSVYQPAHQPFRFGTEDVDFEDPSAPAYPPAGPHYGAGAPTEGRVHAAVQPQPPPPPPPGPVIPPPPAPRPPAPPAPVAAQGAATSLPAEVAMAQPQPGARPQAPPPPAASAVSDEQILSIAPIFEHAYSEGIEPEQIASDLIAQAGPQASRAIAMSVSAEHIARVLMRSPGGAAHVLVKRDGQRFLNDVIQAVLAATGG